MKIITQLRSLIILVIASLISQSIQAADQVVTNNSDTGVGSLRQAITDVTDGGTITFNLASGSETITLASELSITKSVTINGSNAPGAKTVLFKTKLYNPIANVGVRSTTNGNISNTAQNLPNIHWMKIQRTSSNTFKIFTSYDGTTWNRRYTATGVMPNCIEAGIFTESIQANRTVTSWFDHAEVVGYLKSEEEGNVMPDSRDAFEISFYPNPAKDRITITIPENTQKVRVTLISSSGLVVETSEFNAMDAEYPISHIKAGMYLLRFERDGMIVNKRLVVL